MYTSVNVNGSKGHTATLYQGDKLLVFGGENEHRSYLSDVVIFDLNTAHWTQPAVHGPIPKGRARHAAVLHEDKLFIVGGLTGNSNHVLDDICYLDLKTWTWSRAWRFVGRFDHAAWIWGGRMWVFGGLGEDMDRGGELWWLDLKGSPAFDSNTGSIPSGRQSPLERMNLSHRFGQQQSQQLLSTSSTGYMANSSSVQQNPVSIGPVHPPVAPGSISALKFVSGANFPPQSSGKHFHAYSSGSLLDLVTPAQTIRASECTLSALDLDSLSWQKLADGPEIFNMGYSWHYCALNDDGTKAWLLGCANSLNNDGEMEEYLSEILPLDLRKFGLLGNNLTNEPHSSERLPASDRHATSPLSAIGVDLAATFDKPPEQSGTDFIVTANSDDNLALVTAVDEDEDFESTAGLGNTEWLHSSSHTSPPIHVHKLILTARWPHFSRLYTSQMAEFHTKKMHIPEAYSIVRAFLYYLYTDSIARNDHDSCPSLADVAGMLVMSNLYDMPRLRLLCVNRLGRELDVDNAAVIWEKATVADEEWLRRRAASFCLTHWGRIVRTVGFKRMSRKSIVHLCEAIDIEGRVVGGEELEVVGGLGGGRFGVGGSQGESERRRRDGVDEDPEDGEDEGMEMG